MHLIQLLLPLFDKRGRAQSPLLFRDVERELTDRFGGITAYTRAPAQGKWTSEDGAVERDEIVVCEVMADDLDRAWWADYRATLARRFDQDELVVRSMVIETL